MTRPVLALRGVSFAYRGVAALQGVDLAVEAGELVGIVGPSGAGKTTLLKLLTGQLTPTSGTIEVDGRRRGRRSGMAVGYVPQLEASERSFPLTVQAAVELGAAARSRHVPWFGAAERAESIAALERLGIASLARRRLDELSGGQFQRVLLARALLARPRLLLLDEPTSGIDLATRAEILSLLSELAGDGLTVVLSTHDLNWVAAHLPRIVCLNRAIVADGDPQSVLQPAVLREAFGADTTVIEHDGRPVVVDARSPVVTR